MLGVVHVSHWDRVAAPRGLALLPSIPGEQVYLLDVRRTIIGQIERRPLNPLRWLDMLALEWFFQ